MSITTLNSNTKTDTDSSDLKNYYKNSYAVIIGINEYKEESPLTNAGNDAKAVMKVLEKTYDFITIKSIFNQEATGVQIREIFYDTLQDEKRIGPKDRVIVYYSGHGKLRTILGRGGEGAGFMSSGTIDSLIHTPKAQWIATGNWRMTVDNGTLTYFETNMTWFNSNGTSSHTHEFRNLNVGGKIITIQQPGNSVSLRGVMDVGTNHQIVWRNVPTTIDIHGGKTIIISVDDKATNHHFAGQSVLGVVTSFVREPK